ncbi:GrpB family protein [Caldibacillus lycopersici]|uniref:GrpB family protein n=1 Tax=Perspicuibacillus lycopersici TaxID=1325689 RepID=A0AAE3IRP0_9BACI|nr:GrpB family protein [Perspicuibacillus lycopersici]MCU9613216.1 GrpB family protein [Perspicuibacillus lycopersici]
MRKVEVTQYNNDWPAKFQQEADKIGAIFGTEIIDIYHIGSTSVPGLSAKPIIDSMVVVKNLHHVDNFNNEMMAIGYEPKGENGIPRRRYFQKGGDNRTHHVHIYAQGDPNIDRHLAFRDYLRTHPDALKQYGQLKEALANQFPTDIAAYIAGKEQLVLAIEKKAVAWYQRK